MYDTIKLLNQPLLYCIYIVDIALRHIGVGWKESEGLKMNMLRILEYELFQQAFTVRNPNVLALPL